MPTPADAVCRYRIDRDGRLTFVDRGWCDFAIENGAPDLAVPERLYGRPLLSFISDSTTLHVYSLLMERVAAQQETVVVPFRCDAPELRRWLQLEMAPHEDGIEFAIRRLRTESRQAPLRFDQPGTRADLLVRMCSWCKDVELESNRWGPVEHAVRAFELFRDDDVPGITHGICPSCAKQFENE